MGIWIGAIASIALSLSGSLASDRECDLLSNQPDSGHE